MPGLTVVSEAMRDRLEALARVRDVTVQPMGIDLRELFHEAETTTRASNEILFVGRLVEKKGLSHLIDAMPKILEQHPGVLGDRRIRTRGERASRPRRARP